MRKDDVSKKLSKSGLVGSEFEDAYRNVELEIVSAGTL